MNNYCCLKNSAAAQIRINRACVDLVVTVTVAINGLHNNADTYIMELGTHGGLSVCEKLCVFTQFP